MTKNELDIRYKKTAYHIDGFFGRSGEVRTRGLLNPIQARYQAAPHPDGKMYFIIRFCENQQHYFDATNINKNK